MFSRKIIRVVFFMVLTLVFSSNFLIARESKKKKAFNEFVEVFKIQEHYNQIQNMMVFQGRNALTMQFNQYLPTVTEMTDAKQGKFDEVQKELTVMRESSEKNLMDQITIELEKELSFSKFIDEVYYPIYDKYFSASDLKSIVKFYKSSVGQKFMSTGPNIVKEVMTSFNEIYGQKLQAILETSLQGEMEKQKESLEKFKANSEAALAKR